MLQIFSSGAKHALKAACVLFTAAFSLSTQAQTISVGSGTGNASDFPINHNSGYNYTQTIYTAAEINAAGGVAGLIHRIKYLPRVSWATDNWHQWTIYFGNTTKTSFANTSDWVSVSALTQVFNGSIPSATTAGVWMQLTLSTPFYWDGSSNLVVAIHEKTPSGSGTSSKWAGYVQLPASGKKGILYRNSSINPNPSSPPTASMTSNTVAQVQFEFGTPCSGVPAAVITATTDSACQGVPFNLTASEDGSIGLQYQYQYSLNGTTWYNLGFVTNSTAHTITNQTTATYYRVKVSCVSGSSAFSAPVFVAQHAPTECYCTPSLVNSTAQYYLSNFSTEGGVSDINKTTGFTPSGFTDYYNSDSATVIAGSTLTYYMTTEGYVPHIGHAIWIDYNQNGYFEADERIAYSTVYGANFHTGTFTIPADAAPGPRRMRVVAVAGIISPDDPCFTFGNGEYEDYQLVIAPMPVCNGAPAPGATYANSTTVCMGSPVTLGFENHPNVSGLTYAWYSSTDGGFSWNPIPGANDSTYITVPTQNTMYQVAVTCAGSSATATSTPVAIGFYNNMASVGATAICGTGSATLTATPDTGSVLWYGSATSELPLAAGEVFTTPALSSSTTFYAAPVSYIPVTATVGNGLFSTVSGSPVYSSQSPFDNQNGNSKHQMLILASELSAAGMVAGPIHSVAFTVTGSPGGAYNTFSNFGISLKLTNTVAMTASFEDGATMLYTGDYTPVTGVNTFTLSSPFMWDGVSNLIVQTCFSNGDWGNEFLSADVKYDNTSYPSHTLWSWNGVVADVCDIAMGNSWSDGPVLSKRPQMIFNASGTCAGLRVPVVAAVDEPVTVDLGSTVTICAGETLTLDAGTGAGAYAWNTGAASHAIEVSEPGIYEVTVQEGACSSSASLEVLEMPAAQTGAIVAINNAPEFSFSAPEAMGGVNYNWAFGDGATATGASATHTYAANGTYEVTFTAENACGEVTTTATKVTVSGLGIAQTQHAGHLVQLYPNPTSGRTTISANGAVIAKVEVMDNLGRVVLRSEPAAEQAVIDAGNLAKGVYTLRIYTSKGMSTAKLVVNEK